MDSTWPNLTKGPAAPAPRAGADPRASKLRQSTDKTRQQSAARDLKAGQHQGIQSITQLPQNGGSRENTAPSGVLVRRRELTPRPRIIARRRRPAPGSRGVPWAMAWAGASPTMRARISRSQRTWSTSQLISPASCTSPSMRWWACRRTTPFAPGPGDSFGHNEAQIGLKRQRRHAEQPSGRDQGHGKLAPLHRATRAGLAARPSGLGSCINYMIQQQQHGALLHLMDHPLRRLRPRHDALARFSS